MFKHVLIPTDGSDLSNEAVIKGVEFARAIGAEVTFVTVVETFHVFTTSASQVEATRAEYEVEAKLRARDILERAEAKAAAAGLVSTGIDVDSDTPYEGIIATARRRGCDLIAMASHGRRGIAAVVLGSETLKVLTHSDIPVLVYR
jgi:nucleotide-binding universal stress UspA family protein